MREGPSTKIGAGCVGESKQQLRACPPQQNTVDFKRAAIAAIQDITKEPDFGSGIATRLIALAKPEFGVSVNAGSATNLATLSATPRSLGRPQNYSQLLDWIYKQPWFVSPQP